MKIRSRRFEGLIWGRAGGNRRLTLGNLGTRVYRRDREKQSLVAKSDLVQGENLWSWNSSGAP